MTTAKTRPGAAASSLDAVFHPRSVAIAGVSMQQPGFAGVGLGFLLSLMELGFPAVYPVNPKYQEIEGLRCYASVLDIEGPVDHVISSVPARIVPQLVEACIAKGVRSVHFFTAGCRETADASVKPSATPRLPSRSLFSRAGARPRGPVPLCRIRPASPAPWPSSTRSAVS